MLIVPPVSENIFQGCRRSGTHAMIEEDIVRRGGGVLYNNLSSSSTILKSQTLRYGDGDLEYYLWEDKVVCGALVILRSAYNCVASRLNGPAYLAAGSRRLDRFESVWPQHARLVLSGAKHWNYDLWITSTEWNRRPRRGSGSSFDDREYLRRYEQVKLPQGILDNDEIRELNWEVFGWTLDKTGARK